MDSENITRVLIADDDPLSLKAARDVLEGPNMEVVCVTDGPQAVERVSTGDIDIVIMDVTMPRMDGHEACRIIKSLDTKPFIPVIMVTARTSPDERARGLRIGADDYICKPFDAIELSARVGAMLRIKKMHDEVAEAKERLARLAIRDELTGLFNFRYLHGRLTEEFQRAQRYREPLACAMIDIDHFKTFNDRYGHDFGDAVLAEVGRRLQQAVREIDVVARYGGEEFCIVLPSTHFAGALTVADRIWGAIRGTTVTFNGVTASVTVSIGVALYPGRDVLTKEALLKAADTSMYQAKDDGRDRICVFQHQGFIYRPATRRPTA